MKSSRSGRPRLGALPPRYSFVLNPEPDVRYSTCPRCNAKTRLRKFPLAIHIGGLGFVVLGKTCRLCPECDVLIVHQDELEPIIRQLARVDAAHMPEYFVLGTVERATWRRGMAGDPTVEETTAHMADFKEYLTVQYSRGGWVRRGDG